MSRHRTLHQALDWSDRLLGADEQHLFRTLGVFVGGYTLDLVVAVITDDPAARWDVIDRLGTLADRSLIVVGTDDPARYRLLETRRLYAVEQLCAQPDDAQATRRRHALAMRTLFARFTAMPDLGLRERLQVHGALVYAATVREDLDAILRGRLAEMELAQQMGHDAIAAGAESNVVFVRNAINRFDEVAARGRRLLAPVDAGVAGAKGNLPWVLQGLLSALGRRGSLDEAQALVPRAWAACQQFGAPVVAPTVALLAALRGRFGTASRRLGHAQAAFAAREISMDRNDREILALVQAMASEAPGELPFEAHVAHGRRIDAAAALASGDRPDHQAG